MIFQFRVDMFLRPNNEKIASDFIMHVCVYLKYIHLQNKRKTDDFLYQICRLFALLNSILHYALIVKVLWMSIDIERFILGLVFTFWQKLFLLFGKYEQSVCIKRYFVYYL